MRIVFSFIRILVCALCVFFALAFIGIEGFVLFAGEWKLFENGAISLLQTLLKLAVSVFAFYTAFVSLIKPGQSKLTAGAGFFLSSLISVPFLNNHIGWVFVSLSILFILTDKGLWRLLFQKSAP